MPPRGGGGEVCSVGRRFGLHSSQNSRFVNLRVICFPTVGNEVHFIFSVMGYSCRCCRYFQFHAIQKLRPFLKNKKLNCDEKMGPGCKLVKDYPFSRVVSMIHRSVTV